MFSCWIIFRPHHKIFQLTFVICHRGSRFISTSPYIPDSIAVCLRRTKKDFRKIIIFIGRISISYLVLTLEYPLRTIGHQSRTFIWMWPIIFFCKFQFRNVYFISADIRIPSGLWNQHQVCISCRISTYRYQTQICSQCDMFRHSLSNTLLVCHICLHSSLNHILRGGPALRGLVIKQHISMVSCQKGPTRHAYAWQIGPFWQDNLDITIYLKMATPEAYRWGW